MKFSFLSWNVRQYKGSKARLEDADELITSLNPDIFGLIEFRAKKQMRKLMFDMFPEYDFAVTDSKLGLEITAGWKRGKFKQVIWTQKRDFRNQNPNMRPGSLLSVNLNNQIYNLLFLHTDSGTDAAAYKTRGQMFKKIWKLRNALEKASSSRRANLIALGDLNTMGKGRTISGEAEIKKLAKSAKSQKMELLPKNQSYTWHQWGKGPRGPRRRKLKTSELADAKKSDLDHVLASKELRFKKFNRKGDKIDVQGWNQLSGMQRVNFLWDLSDHSAIYGEVL